MSVFVVKLSLPMKILGISDESVHVKFCFYKFLAYRTRKIL